MLTNLQTDIDQEQAEDEKVFTELQGWCSAQTSSTEQSIGTLRGSVESLGAALARLRAQEQTLGTRVAQLTAEAEATQAQITDAKDKRKQEHEGFVQEQQDFDNSIAACMKAIEILKKHYGDGSAPESTRPDWMSLVQVARTLSRTKLDVPAVVQQFLQQTQQVAEQVANPGFFGKTPSFHGVYEGATDAGLDIVSQMGVLQQTFVDDKQSAIDDENRLQQSFDSLIAEKTATLQSLTSERDEQQSLLNQVTQEAGEKETAKANAEQALADEEAYLAAVKQQCADGEAMFNQRKTDRAQERQAVQEAIKVLEQSRGSIEAVAFIQIADMRACRGCPRAAAELAEASRRFGSELLATAAAVTVNAPMAEVISALQELLRRLDGEEVSERAHKEWCDSELSATNAKKQEHESAAEELQTSIDALQEVIGEKQAALADNRARVQAADAQFAADKAIREEQRKDAEAEQSHYRDSLEALGQAIQILSATFKPALVQAEPAPAFGAFKSKSAGGQSAIALLQGVEAEFQQGMEQAGKMEKAAQEEFAQTEERYEAARAGLLRAQDDLQAALQSAQETLDQQAGDLAAHQKEASAAAEYLRKLGTSCGALLAHFDARAKLRDEERTAIHDAVAALSAV